MGARGAADRVGNGRRGVGIELRLQENNPHALGPGLLDQRRSWRGVGDLPSVSTDFCFRP